MKLQKYLDLEALTKLRRDLHQHPELGFEEIRTSRIVADYLLELGLEVEEGIAETGVVATLRGEGRSVGLRADMDALALEETSSIPWVSRLPGKMHACGHDGHITMLLGAATVLSKSPPNGTVHFIFQPAEEGRGGAKKMMEEGLFEKISCDTIFGLHNMPGLETNQIAVASGPQLASSDSWMVEFEGKSTHGAKPHLGSDCITASGHFLTTLQTIIGRLIDPLQPAVISACSIHGGDPKALNVIPDQVSIGGTARAYSIDVRNRIEEEIGHLAKGTAETMGVKMNYEYIRRIPPVVNHPDATKIAQKAAVSVCGKQALTSFPPSTAGDDFAFFSETIPGAYAWLGNGPIQDGALHHNSNYDFNDQALLTGISFWVEVANEALAS